MADRRTFEESPTHAPRASSEILWQVFVTGGIDGGEEITVEYLIEAAAITGAITRALEEMIDEERGIDEVHGIVAKRMPAVIR